MNEAEELPPVEVDRIADVGIPRSESADPFTAKELRTQGRLPGRPSPSDRHAASVALHIEDIGRDRDRLRDENRDLRGELDRLRPRHADLREAFGSALASNVFSTVMVGEGGSLISGAGYEWNESWKVGILVAGASSFLWGLFLQITSTWRSTLFRGEDTGTTQPGPPDIPDPTSGRL